MVNPLTSRAKRQIPKGKSVSLVHSYCALCNSDCAAVYRVEDGKLVGAEPDPAHPNGVGLCPKGRSVAELVYSPHRLMHPLKRTRPKGEPDPGWVQVSWEEALATTADRLRDIKAKYGPEAVFFYRPGPGGSPAHDFHFWVFRLAHAFGTPNVAATGHICNWHRDMGSRHTYGVGMPEPDFERSACILIWAHNPYATKRSFVRRIADARARGAKLIVIDPRRNEIARKADLWLQVRPGSDGALALGMIQVIVSAGLYDYEFVRDWTNAPLLVRLDTGNLLTQADLAEQGSPKRYVVWDETTQGPQVYSPGTLSYGLPQLQPALRGSYRIPRKTGVALECKPAFELLAETVSSFTPERTEEITWIPREKVREAALTFASTKPACYFTYNGLEQQTNAMQTNRAICILYALTGNFDAPGGNVIFPKLPVNAVDGIEFLPEESAKKRLGWSQRPLGPAARIIQAYEAYKAILSGKPYPVKGFVSFGGDIVMSNGDTLRGWEALKALDFYVQVELFMTPAAELADIVLPAATFLECSHLKTDFTHCQGVATSTLSQWRPQVIPPLGECWPDVKIIFELARRLGLGDRFWDGDVEAAFEHMLEPSGLTLETVKSKPRGLSLPLPVEYRKYQGEKGGEKSGRGFNTPSRKIEVYSQVFKDRRYEPLPVFHEPLVSPFSRPDQAQQYPLILTNFKLLHFCHGQHRALPSLRRQVPHPFVEIHPGKAAELDIHEGEWVIVESPHASIKLRAKLNDGIDPRVVYAQHGWWQACPELALPGYDPYSAEGANVNLLVLNDVIDPITGSVPHKAYLCRLRKPS